MNAPETLPPAAAEAAHDAFAALRRDIHAHPELGFEEQRTSALVAARLQALGLEVHRLAETGVVALVHGRDGGACGRRVGLRADMDALPMQEHNTFAHASRHAGVMHACGHDGHTTMLLAAAERLARERDFDGSVLLIFQPAEEGRGGAQRMLAEGLFERWPVEAVFGLHNWPGIPAGHFACSAGPVMAAGSTFKIVVRGKGSHAALPHLGVDPVPVACQIVLALQTVISRNVKPVDTAVLSVTMLHTGEAINVVPDSATLEGTVRCFRDEVTDLVEQRLRAVATHTAAAAGAGVELEFLRRVPAVVNTPHEAAVAARAARAVVGDAAVQAQGLNMPSEDFAYMLKARPGAYLFIGNGDATTDGDHRLAGHGLGPCALHNPSYDFNDRLIPVGAAWWVAVARQWLAEPAPR